MPSLPRRNIDAPALEAARLLSRIGIFLLFVISQLVPILARQTVYILLPIGTALLLVGAVLSPEPRRPTPWRDWLFSAPVAAALFLVAWTGLSLAWTPFGAGPSERFAKSAATLALVAAAAAFLPTRTKTSNLNLLPIGAAAAALTLAAIAVTTHKAVTLDDILDVGALGRVGLGLALLVWPAMGALAVRDRWPFAGALAIATLAACYLAQAPNALPALGLGAAAFAASFGRPRRAAAIFGALGAAVVLLAPVAALVAHFVGDGRLPLLLKPLAVWGNMLVADGGRALIGHGYGAAIFGFLGGYLDIFAPRSLVFQLWFDLGALGAAGFALVVWRAFVVVGETRPALAPFLLAGLATGFVICVVGPAAEQLWWFTLAGLDALAFALVIRGQFRKRRPRVPLGWGEASLPDDETKAPE
jgi:hypothetical protein